jgi:hypothetical protein
MVHMCYTEQAGRGERPSIVKELCSSSKLSGRLSFYAFSLPESVSILGPSIGKKWISSCEARRLGQNCLTHFY